jgi:sigma-B regulation protein RsbU (phosphoserine phosphatase)
MYSDGITEAEDPAGQPFEERGLEQVVERFADESTADIAVQVLKAVEAHAKASRFIDDLTILLLKRTA